MRQAALDVEIAGFDVQDGVLHVAGKRITEMMQADDDVPLYIYDLSLVRQRVSKLRKLLPGGMHLHYAIKANPHPTVVNFLSKLVDGLDVASAGEMHLALDTGMSSNQISFAGPGKTDAELHSAVAAGVTINCESQGELHRILRIGSELGFRPRVALRVNPAFELKSSGMKMSGGAKPFGIDEEMVPELLDRWDSDAAEFVGLHIFTGSQNLDAQAICESQNLSYQLALELSQHAPMPPALLNLGGGFGIPYFKGDRPLDLEAVGKNLAEIAARNCDQLPGTELAIELGRYLVGEAGIYVCRVVDIKVSRGQTFLVTNGGLHHHLAASGNFGQVIRKNYPVVIGNRISDTTSQTANIVGPLCTPLDVIATNVGISECEIGDLVVVFQSGAYGYTASPRSFLGHPNPREVVLGA